MGRFESNGPTAVSAFILQLSVTGLIISLSGVFPMRVAGFCKKLSKSGGFQNGIFLAIVISSISVGLETYPLVTARYGAWLHWLDRAILAAFVVELAVRIAARGSRPWLFFLSPWNLFDFLIVLACLLPIHAGYIVVLRLFRVLRVLRIITALPRLQILVGALLNSIPSIAYVALLLFIQFYIYAAIGVTAFGRNDPLHFGTLTTAMLTLFEVITLEGWVDVLYIQMYGSDQWAVELFQGMIREPSAVPVAAVLYFVSFILLGTMIILNLFVGVIINAIEEQQETVEMGRLLGHQKAGKLTIVDQLELIALQMEDLKESVHSLRSRVRGEASPYRLLAIRKKMLRWR